MPANALYYGDNLDILRGYIAPESIDLVYLDPPFNSNATYNVLFAEHSGEKAASQIQAFEDTWTWDEQAARTYFETVQSGGEVANALNAFYTLLGESNMMAYLAMMAPRLVELRRVLKPTGSIYLHCDPTASHYLKLLMDAVFGPVAYRNEIVWQRTNARSTKGRWPRLHDTLLYYAKTPATPFDPVTVAADPSKMPHTLITGSDGRKYQTYELTAPGVTKDGESGKPWRGFDPSAMGRHWGNTPATMDEWDALGEIHWPKGGGFPRRRAAEPFEPTERVVTVGDIWTDIDRINQSAKELLGYPTQKPEALLERIIRASSNEGDVVLDPFCGCGTAIAVAQRLKRRWVGIDITHLAVNLMKHRLLNQFGEGVKSEYEVIREPTDVEGARQLAKEDPYQFQWWALGLVGARPVEQKKGVDKGIDGRIYFHEGSPTEIKQVILSVKAGGNIGRHFVHELRGVMEREGAEIAVLISMESPTKPMREEAASAGFYQSPWGTHPRIQLFTVAALLDGMRIDAPPMGQVGQTFKKAPKAASPQHDTPSLFADEEQ